MFNDAAILQYNADHRQHEHHSINERVIGKVIGGMSRDPSVDEVYLLVTLIDALFSTRLKDKYAMAQRIKANGALIGWICEGNREAVTYLRNASGQMRGDYSFATKYCYLYQHYQMHVPRNMSANIFTIFDNVVSRALWLHLDNVQAVLRHNVPGKRLGYRAFYTAMNSYETYLGALDALKAQYKLGVDNREFEMYLYLQYRKADSREMESRKAGTKTL